MRGTDLVTPLAKRHFDLKRLSNVLSEEGPLRRYKSIVLALELGFFSIFELYLLWTLTIVQI